MGIGSSKERLSERIAAARQKLAADKQLQAALTQQIETASTETLHEIVQSVRDSIGRCAPFSERLLLVAFAANPEEIQRLLAKCCKQVLSAPIRKDEYAWFKRYVFPSMVWMQRNERGELLFEHLLAITKSMSEKVDNSMDSILAHLKTHKEWPQVMAIENETVVARQDDDRVGLLKDQGIRDVADVKQDEDGDDEDDMSAFIDSNLNVNIVKPRSSIPTSRNAWASS